MAAEGGGTPRGGNRAAGIRRSSSARLRRRWRRLRHHRRRCRSQFSIGCGAARAATGATRAGAGSEAGAARVPAGRERAVGLRGALGPVHHNRAEGAPHPDAVRSESRVLSTKAASSAGRRTLPPPRPSQHGSTAGSQLVNMAPTTSAWFSSLQIAWCGTTKGGARP